MRIVFEEDNILDNKFKINLNKKKLYNIPIVKQILPIHVTPDDDSENSVRGKINISSLHCLQFNVS